MKSNILARYQLISVPFYQPTVNSLFRRLALERKATHDPEMEYLESPSQYPPDRLRRFQPAAT